MFIGANPAVSGASLFHLPHAVRRLRAVVRGGGRVVFINPRRTETGLAGQQIFIRPDTDVFFLAAFLSEILRERLYHPAHVERPIAGLQALPAPGKEWKP